MTRGVHLFGFYKKDSKQSPLPEIIQSKWLELLKSVKEKKVQKFSSEEDF